MANFEKPGVAAPAFVMHGLDPCIQARPALAKVLRLNARLKAGQDGLLDARLEAGQDGRSELSPKPSPVYAGHMGRES